MEETLRAGLLAVVRSPTPQDVDETKYCRYHQNRGHTTEDCVTLKDKVESLVQAGHLRVFFQRGRERMPAGVGQPTHQNEQPKQEGPRREERSRSRSRERSVQGVINTISRGFARGGTTILARKRHLRNLHNVNRVEVLKKSMLAITFSDDDFHVPDPDQDDPMVITAMIARYQVGKLFIDQGSSTKRWGRTTMGKCVRFGRTKRWLESVMSLD